MGRSVGGLIGVLALLALPAVAGATTVTWSQACPPKGGAPCSSSIAVVAGPGERNVVSVRPVATGIEIVDATAPVTTSGCTAVDGGTVDCPSGSVSVMLGDGDDLLTVASEDQGGVTADGGPGNDALLGGAGPDTLTGGPGTDSVGGAVGDDLLIDGGPAGESDAYDGGPGADRISYIGRTTAVTVDLLAPTTAGGPGENDSLASIEGADGGDGADTLSGDDGPNVLAGAGGGDTVRGLGGADTLGGGAGRNRLDGGDGNDLLSGQGGANDAVCGPGVDELGDARADDVAHTDCERARFAVAFDQFVTLAPLASARAPVARLNRFDCEDEPCELRLELRTTRGQVVGSASAHVRANRARTGLSVRLSAAGRALLARSPALRLVVRFVVYGDTSAVGLLLPRP